VRRLDASGILSGMVEKRLSNSELRLKRLEEQEEAEREGEKGIFELFPQDEDAPLARDEDGEQGS
jgi:hypothetical protein